MVNYLIVVFLRASGKNVEVQTWRFMSGLTLYSTKYCLRVRRNLEHLDFS